MHKDLTQDAQVLRRGSYRFMGPLLIGIAAFSGYMLWREGDAFLSYLIPLLFACGGIWFLRNDSRYILFITNGRIIWADHHGKSRVSGDLSIANIRRLEVWHLSPANRRVATKLQLELVTSDDKHHVLPANLNFGGTGNPRYDDLVSALRQHNPALEVEVQEGTGWRHSV